MAVEYQGSSTGGSYRPNKALQQAGGNEENDQRIMQSLQGVERVQRLNDQTAMEAARRKGEGLKALSKFSSQLSKQLVAESQKQNLREYEAGIEDAYFNGVSPEEAVEFDTSEAAVMSVGQTTDALGVEFTATTGDAAGGEQISASSGWRALGRATGIAKQGGANYPMYLAQMADQEVNGVSLNSASTAEEYSMVMTGLRRNYLSKFGGMSRGLMAKYMFPAMQKQESSQFLNWQDTNNTRIQNNRITEMGDQLYADVASGNGGQAFIDFITKNEAFLGGKGNARKKAMEIIEDGIANGKITEDDIESMREFTFDFNGSFKKIGEIFGKDFDALKDKLSAETYQTFQQEQQVEAIAKKGIIDNIRKAQSDLGRAFTDEEKKEILRNWPPELGPPPSELNQIITQESMDAEDAVDYVEARIEAGYQLTEEDLEGIPMNQRQNYNNFMVGNGVTSEQKERNKAYIRSLVDNQKQITDGEAPKTPEWNNMYDNASAEFQQRLTQNLRTMEPADAIAEAKQYVTQRIADGSITDKLAQSSGNRKTSQVVTAQYALQDNPNLWKQNKLPGSEDAIKLLEADPKTLPKFYIEVAKGLKNVSAWDLATRQAELAGIAIEVPEVEDEMSAQDIQGLMKYKPSTSKALRVMRSNGSGAAFLDLMSGPESAGDYNAYNEGGKKGGTVAINSGFGDAAANKYGKDLTQMTLGEMVALGTAKTNWIWAAGRYQIIPPTLRGLIKNYDLDPNALFDEEMQDNLALLLAYQRLNSGQGITGLRNEWIGLRKVSADAIRASLGEAFNNPQVLLKGV